MEKETSTVKPVYDEAYYNEPVDVFIPEDNNIDNGGLPVNVTVNGETVTIQRGEHVRVARKFAEVVEHSLQSQREARLFTRKHSGKSTQLA